jgi:3-oxoacyl-[acyl-carrier protein] reductase
MKILVTGSAQGLGRAVIERLAGQGDEAVVHYRSSRGPAEQVAAGLEKRGVTAHLLAGDLTVHEDVERMGAFVEAQMGGLDVLVNNVGGFLVKHVDDLTMEEWDQQLASTVSATFAMTRAVTGLLRASGRGRIVNVSDSAADKLAARPRNLPYYIGKTGVLILTKTLAVTEAPHGVTVNAIMPGVLENSDPLPDPSKIPAGRHGTLDDVAGMIEFLVSEDAAYVTGSFIQVGGGWNL